MSTPSVWSGQIPVLLFTDLTDLHYFKEISFASFDLSKDLFVFSVIV